MLGRNFSLSMSWPETPEHNTLLSAPVIMHRQHSGTSFILFWAIFSAIVVLLTKRHFKSGTHHKTPRYQIHAPDSWTAIDFITQQLFGRPSDGFVAELHRSFEDIGSTYGFKRSMWYATYTRDSENIKHILASRFGDYDIPDSQVSAIETFLGRGIFTFNGDLWSHARSSLKPEFAKHALSFANNAFERHFQRFLARLAEAGQIVDLQPLIFYLIMDIATEIFFGTSSGILSNKFLGQSERRLFDDCMLCSTTAVKGTVLGPLRHFLYGFKVRNANKRLHAYVDHLIATSLAARAKNGEAMRHTLLYRLADSTTDDGVIRDQMLHILLASRDTTSSLLSSLIFLLAGSPGIYAKLRDEVLAHVGQGRPESPELNDLEHLNWCVLEALRLYPPVPVNARLANMDTYLPKGAGPDGNEPLFIKKGSLVIYSTFSMHRNKRVFGQDSDEFRPERWEGLRPQWDFLPFSGGPRVCMGQQLALAEVRYIMVRLVQTFGKLNIHDAREWKEQYGLTLSCENGVHVSLVA